jgi:acetyl-CoA synthetase
VRDGYGQTETTAQIGNSPGQPVKPGSMGRPLPGYRVTLLEPGSGRPADTGEISLDLADRPLGLMAGYRDETERDAAATRGGYYRTGDVATRDPDGYITYVGRADDLFKASDYRISPFELESVLIEHEAVAEAEILRHCREHLPPFQRVRRLQFGELPKTISGKIRRVELRGRETGESRAEQEYWEEDFPELKG